MASSLTLAPLISDSFDTTVQIIVGQNKKAFTIHKGILYNVTPYFRAAFEGQFLESPKQVLEFPEEDETLFRHFQLWVYTKDILEDGEEIDTMNWKVLVDLYIFGDKYGVSELQNAAINLLIDKRASSRIIPVGTFNHVYENTQASSPLRKLCVDWSVQYIQPRSWFEGNKRGCYPRDFLIDLVVANHELMKVMKPKEVDFGSRRLDYHVNSPNSAISVADKD